MMEMVNDNYERMGSQQKMLSAIMPAAAGLTEELVIKFDTIEALQ